MMDRRTHPSQSRRPLALATRLTWWCVGAIATISLFACSDPAPVRLDPAATLLVDAPPVAAGNPFEVVVFVRTPAGHRVHGYEIPDLKGLEIIERHASPAHLDGATTVHRETLVARSLDAGEANWPPSEIRVTRPSGETYALPLHGLDFDVPSVFGEDSPPPRPRGYRRIPKARDPGSFAWGAATGALGAGAIALWLARRRRPLGAAHANATDTTTKPRTHFGGPTRLIDELEAARSRLSQNPDVAASAASLALRHWAADRFLVSTQALWAY